MLPRTYWVSVALLTVFHPAAAATWQLSAGPTDSDGSAVEIARAVPRWEVALGYVSVQRVSIRTEQDVCYARATGPECIVLKDTDERDVNDYGYLSVQRRFTFRQDARVQPIIGLGVMASSDTNPYVSSNFAFSLSAALRLGSRWTLEWRHFSNAGTAKPNLGQDIMLLRGQFGQ